MFYRGQGFFAVIWFGSSPHPIPPLPSVSTRPGTQRKTEKEIQLADKSGGEGVGEEPNQTTTRKPCPISIIQYPLPSIYHHSDSPMIQVFLNILMTTSISMLLLDYLHVLFTQLYLSLVHLRWEGWKLREPNLHILCQLCGKVPTFSYWENSTAGQTYLTCSCCVSSSSYPFGSQAWKQL